MIVIEIFFFYISQSNVGGVFDDNFFIFSLVRHKYICCGTHQKRFGEALLISTHTTYVPMAK